MTKFLQNNSKGVICFETKNFIPGAEPVEVTEEELAHPMITAYIDAGKLEIVEVDEPAAESEPEGKAGKQKAGE